MLGLTFEQLENIGFRFVLDALSPSSAYGESAVRALKPFAREQLLELEQELDNVYNLFVSLPALEGQTGQLERLLMQVRDIRGSISRCGGPISEVELFEIKRYLLQLREITPVFDEIQAKCALKGIEFHDLSAAFELLDPEKSGVASFHISGKYSQKLAEIRRKKREIELKIRAFEVKITQNDSEKQPSGIENLRQIRREIVVREQAEEDRVREQLSLSLAPFMQKMLENTDALARLDLTLCKAKLAQKYGGTRPEISQNEIDFDGMISPKALRELGERGKPLTRVSIALRGGTTVITGANMGGKSMALKTLTLNALCTQCGIFPFAKRAKSCLFDSFHILSDHLEDSSRGLSTFGGEIVGLGAILRAATSGFAFAALDEFARGTNPREGAAIARAVAGYLDKLPGISVMATHYDGVSAAASAHFQVIGLENADFSALKGKIDAASYEKRVDIIADLMDYGLRPVRSGGDTPRDALNICRLLGLDDEILKTAAALLEQKYS